MGEPFKFVWSTDWHVSDYAPENRIDDYEAAVFHKLAQLKLLCEKINADICLAGGDIFHVKVSSKVKHGLVARLIKMLKSFPCPVYSTIGNHDISHNSLDTLPEKPLGVVFNSGAMKRLDEETFVKGDVKVRIVGKHFDPKVELNAFDSLQKGDEDHLLVVYHGYACATGISYPGETTFRYDTLAKLPVDDWYFGHWHVDQGVSEIDGKNFVNIGSLTRGALNQENVFRTPKAVVCSYWKDKRNLQQVKLKVKPASEIFNIERKERIDKEQALINQFIQNLRTEVAVKHDGESQILTRIGSYNIAQDVRECVLQLIEESELELRSRRAS
jgi:DNA repair exonuclease SbcCD nuclease subunit